MIIGVVGGMGSYATLHFFKRYLEVFPAEKEWDRPRIVIDNRCSMPGRVRAILYGERRDEVVAELSESVAGLLGAGCDRIVLACNTSHVFLEEVYGNVPEAEGKILHLIELCADKLRQRETDSHDTVSLIATEGTIEAGIYQKVFSRHGIALNIPDRSVYPVMRGFIEAVKQNKIDARCKESFGAFLDSFPRGGVVLGCTEFSALYAAGTGPKKPEAEIIDPLEIVLDHLHRAFLAETDASL